MKHFLLIVLTSAICSCKPTTTTTDLMPVYLHIIDDPSSTRKGAQRLDTAHVNQILKSFIGSNSKYSLKLRVTHLAMPHPTPVVLEIVPASHVPDPFDPDYKLNLARVTAENATNKSLIIKFLTNCNDEICHFRVSGKSDDFTYVNRHIRALAGSLSAPVKGLKFALIQSDFINSEPGQDDDWIDAQVVQSLNTALSDETTYCIIVSDVDFSTSPLNGLPNISVVASWEDAIAVMEEKLNQSPSMSLHPTIKNN